MGKALLTEYKLPWKEAAGHRQYGLHTPDGVNMVLLLTEDALATAQDMCAVAIDGRNSFNEAKQQRILNTIQARFAKLSTFVETWYLTPSPLWLYMDDHSIAIIWSSQGVHQGDVLSSFLFSIILNPILEIIETTLAEYDPRAQVLAILDDITINIGAASAALAFETATAALRDINIQTVPRKSHILLHDQSISLLASNVDPQIQVHNDGIKLLGSAIASDDFLHPFLQAKITQTEKSCSSTVPQSEISHSNFFCQ